MEGGLLMSYRHSLAKKYAELQRLHTKDEAVTTTTEPSAGQDAAPAAPFTILIIGNTEQDCRGFLGLRSDHDTPDGPQTPRPDAPYLKVPDDVWPPDIKATAKLRTVDQSLDLDVAMADLIIITRRACRLLSTAYCESILGLFARKIYRDDR